MKEATGLIIGLQEQRKEDLSSNMVLPKQHGFAEYAKWHLGEDDEEPEGNKRRASFPMGLQ